MRSDDVIPLFTGREVSALSRRKARAAWGLAGALALAIAPMVGTADGSRLPPGHPPVGSEELPPGHPPLSDRGGGGACSPDLPQGHPPVVDPRVPEGHPPIEIRPCGPGGASRDASPSPQPGVRKPVPLFVPMFPDRTVVET